MSANWTKSGLFWVISWGLAFSVQAAPFIIASDGISSGTLNHINVGPASPVSTFANGADTTSNGSLGGIVHVNRAGNKIYSIRSSSSSLCKFSYYSDTNTSTSPFELNTLTGSCRGLVVNDSDTYAYAVTEHPTGKSYVYTINLNSQTLSSAYQVDTLALNTPSNTPAGYPMPRSIALSPDGTQLYVTQANKGMVTSYSVSGAALTLRGHIGTPTAINYSPGTTPSQPWGLAFSADGTSLFVSKNNADEVDVIDTTTNSIVRTIALTVGSRPLDLVAVGSKIYVANNGAVASVVAGTGYTNTAGTGTTVSVIDTANNDALTSINLQTSAGRGVGPRGIDSSSDGAYVIVVNRDSKDISKITTATGAVATAPVTSKTSVSWLAHGKFVVDALQPLAPTINAVNSTNTSLSITPGVDRGTITNYEYQYYLNNSWGSWTALSPTQTASPIALSLDSNLGTTFRVRALNAAGTGVVSNSVIIPSSLSLTTPSSTVTVGSVLTLTASGDPVNGGALSYAVTGSSGGASCSIGTSNGQLTASAGPGTCSVQATKAASGSVIAATSNVEVITVSVAPALSPSSQSVTGRAGTAITATSTLTTSNFAGSVSYTVSPSLPAGLSINSTTGVISGTPTSSQSLTTYTITGSDSVDTATATVDITLGAAPSISPSTQSVSGRVGTAITASSTLTGSNFTGTVTYAISPSLPGGLSLNSSTGVISGTPTAQQSATTYTVTGSGSVSGAATASVSITIGAAPAISPATQTLSANVGVAITATASLTGNNFTGTVSYSVSPNLPSGLTLNSATGVITGTPAGLLSATTYTITGTGATSGSATATVSITVIAAPSISPASQSLSGRVGTAITATTGLTDSNFTGSVTYTVSPALPAGLSLNSSTGVISGTPTATQSATTHTITGTGATSGSATATVSVTVVNPVPAATGTPMGAPGDGKVTVSWAQAASTTPRPVQYTVTASPGGQTCTANFPGWAFATASCDVTGLTNGTAYTFVVKSSNAMGDTDSSPSTSVTPLSVLNGACGASDGVATLIPPTGLLCSAGVAGIVSSSRGGFSWSCSGTNGGTTSQCFADGDTAPSAQPQAKTTFVSDNVVSGCTTQSARGVTPPSSGPSGIVMPYGAVDFQLVDCTATQATAVLTYSRVIEGMQFWKYVNNSHHQSPRWVQLSPSEVTLRGNTATYVIVDNGPFDNDPALGAISDPGGPGYSPSSLAAPDTPLNVQVAVGDSQAVISWTAASTGSAAITYVVTASPGGLSCTATAPATSCTMPGLTNGTAYTFSVVASNGVGDSTATAASAPATPSAPVAIPSLGEWAMALMGLLMLGFGILRMRRGNGLTQQ